MGLRLLFALLSVFLAADVFGSSLMVFDEQVYSAVTNLSSQVSDLSVQVAGLTNLVFQGSSLALNQALMFLLKVNLWIWGTICALICAVCFFARS
jgi:hypothetical protein